MSTPLFIRTPAIYSKPVAGAVALTPFTSLIEAGSTTEPVLIEELSYSAAPTIFETTAGQLCVQIVDPDLNSRYFGCYAIEAGTADLSTSGRIELNLALPAGWGLKVGHNVKNSDNVTYAGLHVSALGGIVR